MKPIVRPMKPDDFVKIYGLEMPPYRVKGYAGEVDGEVVAVGGIAFRPDGAHIAFMRATDKARQYPMALHKAGLSIMKEARALGILRLVAYAEPGIDAAERWLRRLGFEKSDEVWIWDRQ